MSLVVKSLVWSSVINTHLLPPPLTLLTVTGNGRGTPGPLVAIPGAYKVTDVS